MDEDEIWAGGGGYAQDWKSLPRPMTPRQQVISDSLEICPIRTIPSLSLLEEYETDDLKCKQMLELYQQFTLELHAGIYLKQLTSTFDYWHVHCQLMEDLSTLKIDQDNGRIVEFPLTAVSEVKSMIKRHKTVSCTDDANKVDHIIVVEFLCRKLAFVFSSSYEAQVFMTCLEFLIRRAKQEMQGKMPVETELAVPGKWFVKPKRVRPKARPRGVTLRV